MLRHIVFFRLKDTPDGKTAAQNAAELKRRLEALSPLVPEIRSLEAGLDVLHGDASYDLALTVDLDDLDALERYRVHPEHQKVVQFVKEVTSARAAVDYER
ncbi:MAG: Dabb family protein [Opitutales bacterium]|nr:Dabb family protein [Opitutales bacterium]